MAVLTASIFVGESHPYEFGIIPHFLIQVLEGESITLVRNDLRQPGLAYRWRGVTPDDVGTDVLAMAALSLDDGRQHALASWADVDIAKWTTDNPGSLRNFADELRGCHLVVTLGDPGILKAADFVDLTSVDVQIFQPSYSQIWNRGTQSWDVTSSPHATIRDNEKGLEPDEQ